MPHKPTIRVFVSSPGDVGKEREICHKTIQRLHAEFSDRCVLEPVLWEHEPLRATATFQAQIVRPSETQFVICILWSRLGTRLPEDILKPNGDRYSSGTEFEFLDAQASYAERHEPDLLIYRKTAEPVISGRDVEEAKRRVGQLEALERFIHDHFFYPTGELRVAFHQFSLPEEFEAKVEVHLRKLLIARFPEPVDPPEETAAPVEMRRSPFPGLRPFEFEDEPFFFGREKAINDVLGALAAQAARGVASVIVLGHSGSGKSSLARAGVLPRLVRPGVIEGIGVWQHAIWPPARNDGTAVVDPLLELASALLAPEALPGIASDELDAAQFAGILRSSPERAMGLVLGELSRIATDVQTREGLSKAPRVRLALLIDQMEELYTRPDVTEDARAHFVGALGILARCGRVFVLGTLRADFLARTATTRGFDLLKAGQGIYELGAPAPDELSAMIRHPAAVAGLRFATTPDSAKNLGDVLRDEAQGSSEALPLLQFTLAELFERRQGRVLTFAAYDQIGGVRGALRCHADAALASVPGAGDADLDALAIALATLAPGADARAARLRAKRSQFSGTTLALVEALESRRLLIGTRDDAGEPAVALAHDALLTHWDPLARAVERQRQFLARRGRIRAAVAAWIEAGRPQRWLATSGQPLRDARAMLEANTAADGDERDFLSQSVRTARKRTAVLAVAAVLLIAGAGWWWRETRARATIADQRLGEAGRQIGEAGRKLTAEQQRTERIGALREFITKELERNAAPAASVPHPRNEEEFEFEDEEIAPRKVGPPGKSVSAALSLLEAGRALATEAPAESLAWQAQASGLLAASSAHQDFQKKTIWIHGEETPVYPWTPEQAGSQLEQVLAAWEKAVQPASAEMLRFRGHWKASMKKDARGALADWRSYLESPDRTPAGERATLEGIAHAAETAGEWSDAEDALRRRLALGDDAALRVRRVHALCALRRWTQARVEIETLFGSAPGHPAVRASQQHFDKLVEALPRLDAADALVRASPLDAQRWRQRAAALMEAGLLTIARDDLQFVQKRLAPDSAAVAIELAIVKDRLRQPDKSNPANASKPPGNALELLWETDMECAGNPRAVEPLVARQAQLEKIWQYGLALRDAERLMLLDANNATHVISRIRLLQSLGRFLETLRAMADFERRMPAARSDPYFLAARADVHLKLNRIAEAEADVQASLAIRPTPEALNMRSRIRWKQNRTQEAQADAAAAKRLAAPR